MDIAKRSTKLAFLQKQLLCNIMKASILTSIIVLCLICNIAYPIQSINNGRLLKCIMCYDTHGNTFVVPAWFVGAERRAYKKYDPYGFFVNIDKPAQWHIYRLVNLQDKPTKTPQYLFLECGEYGEKNDKERQQYISTIDLVKFLKTDDIYYKVIRSDYIMTGYMRMVGGHTYIYPGKLPKEPHAPHKQTVDGTWYEFISVSSKTPRQLSFYSTTVKKPKPIDKKKKRKPKHRKR